MIRCIGKRILPLDWYVTVLLDLRIDPIVKTIFKLSMLRKSIRDPPLLLVPRPESTERPAQQSHGGYRQPAALGKLGLVREEWDLG